MSTEGAQTQGASPYGPPIESPVPAAETITTPDVVEVPHRWVRQDLLILGALMLGALVMYLFRLDAPQQYIYDEVYHAYTAARLAEGNPDPYLWNTRVPPEDKERFKVSYEWSHPAFAKLPMEFGIVLFGDNAFGWRFASAICGAIGIGVMFALGRAMLGRWEGAIAAGLLLFDGMWFVQSRTAMNDVFLVTFLLLSYLSFYRYLTAPLDRRWRYLWATGIAIGFALATKWSALYTFGFFGLIAGLRELWLLRGTQRPIVIGIGALLTLLGALVILPAALYVGGYVQFFLMGHKPWQFIELQRQMWVYHSNLKACHDWASPWWSWPLMIKPVWFYVARENGTLAQTFTMGNPAIWWVFIPALGFVLAQWWRSGFRSIALGLIVLGFFGQWLPWAFSPRIQYLYHYLPCVPFGCLAIAYMLGRYRSERRLIAIYLGIVVAVFAFFYSHYTALPVSAAYTNLHYWLPTWVPGSQWAFRCPPGVVDQEAMLRWLLP